MMYATSNLFFASKSTNFSSSEFLGGPQPAKSPGSVVRKVLVVDDEHDLADVTGMMLNAHGLDVVVVYSAREALATLQSDNAINAVFSDIMMPGMTGLELADTVKVMYPDVKIVLTSGYTKSGLFEGRDRPYLFAAKPYRFSTIVELLQS